MLVNLRARCRVESALAVLAFALFINTAVSREWIELLLGVDPDGGSGAVEWGMVVACFVILVALSTLGRFERKRQIAEAAG